jgi:hypothetical protein
MRTFRSSTASILEYFAYSPSIDLRAGRLQQFSLVFIRHSPEMKRSMEPIMIKTLVTLTLIKARMQVQVAVQTSNTTLESENPVVQWNRNPLAIIRKPARSLGPSTRPVASPSCVRRSMTPLTRSVGCVIPRFQERHQPALKKQRQQLRLSRCSSSYIRAFRRLWTESFNNRCRHIYVWKRTRRLLNRL